MSCPLELVPYLDPFGGLPPSSLLITIEFHQRESHNKQSAIKNTAATLVQEAPQSMKHKELEWFRVMIYDVSEASTRETFEAG